MNHLTKQEQEAIEREALPVYIGTLNKKQGFNGFEPAEIGHPVFEYKDRYVIFLKCLTKTVEQIPDGNGGHTKTLIEYNVMIPYYRNTLKPFIDYKQPPTGE